MLYNLYFVVLSFSFSRNFTLHWRERRRFLTCIYKSVRHVWCNVQALCVCGLWILYSVHTSCIFHLCTHMHAWSTYHFIPYYTTVLLHTLLVLHTHARTHARTRAHFITWFEEHKPTGLKQGMLPHWDSDCTVIVLFKLSAVKLDKCWTNPNVLFY